MSESTKTAEYRGIKFERLIDGAVCIRDTRNDSSEPIVIPGDFWPVLVSNMAGWSVENQQRARRLHWGTAEPEKVAGEVA